MIKKCKQRSEDCRLNFHKPKKRTIICKQCGKKTICSGHGSYKKVFCSHSCRDIFKNKDRMNFVKNSDCEKKTFIFLDKRYASVKKLYWSDPFLKKLGINNNGGGTPDFLVTDKDNNAFFVEAKKTTDGLSFCQRKIIKKLITKGERVFLSIYCEENKKLYYYKIDKNIGMHFITSCKI